jgi:hypothetical protein
MRDKEVLQGVWLSKKMGYHLEHPESLQLLLDLFLAQDGFLIKYVLRIGETNIYLYAQFKHLIRTSFLS